MTVYKDGKMCCDGFMCKSHEKCLRIFELEDLLRSFYAVSKREGKDTNWHALVKKLESMSMGSVTTPKTFRIIKDKPIGESQ